MPSNFPIQVSFTTRFEKDTRRLGKRYRSIQADLQHLIQQLEAGELPGDQVPNLEHTVFKVRVKNSNLQKGKSGGYRVIYYLKTNVQIVLVTMYSKSDRSDITAAELEDILRSIR